MYKNQYLSKKIKEFTYSYIDGVKNSKNNKYQIKKIKNDLNKFILVFLKIAEMNSACLERNKFLLKTYIFDQTHKIFNIFAIKYRILESTIIDYLQICEAYSIIRIIIEFSCQIIYLFKIEHKNSKKYANYFLNEKTKIFSKKNQIYIFLDEIKKEIISNKINQIINIEKIKKIYQICNDFVHINGIKYTISLIYYKNNGEQILKNLNEQIYEITKFILLLSWVIKKNIFIDYFSISIAIDEPEFNINDYNDPKKCVLKIFKNILTKEDFKKIEKFI